MTNYIGKMFGKFRRIINKIELGGVKFANSPKCLNVGKDVLFLHPQHISFGEKCSIGQRAALCPLHKHMGMDYPSNITIGNNVSIGAYDRIASAYSVVIEDDVLMAAFVHITDHSHGYEDVSLPICKQPIIHKGPIIIKKVHGWLLVVIFCQVLQLASILW